jgi:hypothetical protein
MRFPQTVIIAPARPAGCRARAQSGHNTAFVGAQEPEQGLLRVGHAALEMASNCSFTTRKLRILSLFRLAWL